MGRLWRSFKAWAEAWTKKKRTHEQKKRTHEITHGLAPNHHTQLIIYSTVKVRLGLKGGRWQGGGVGTGKTSGEGQKRREEKMGGRGGWPFDTNTHKKPTAPNLTTDITPPQPHSFTVQ